MAKQTKQQYREQLRSIIFGVEDSLVSTVGLISGVAVAGMTTKNIILTGVVLIFVEAFSMAVGAMVSENSVEEYAAKKEVDIQEDFGSATAMFFSYLIAGCLVIAPYTLLEPTAAFIASIAVSLLALLGLGVWAGRIAGIGQVKKGLQLMLLGGMAIALGVIVGKLVEMYLL